MSPDLPTAVSSSIPPSSLDSERNLADVGDTCIIFDFDDSLFPTSHIANRCPKLWHAIHDEFSQPRCERNTSEESSERAVGAVEELFDSDVDRDALAECALTAAATLRLAASLGRVCVVTMAKKGWVEACCLTAMPELLDALQELDISIFHAREAVPRRLLRRAAQEGLAIGQFCKEHAMKRALQEMTAANASLGLGPTTWRSVLSVGDSEDERLALQEVLMSSGDAGRGCLKSCYCKTVQFITSPGIEVVLAQLQILVSWLQRLLTRDGDVDVSFDRLAVEGEEMI